MKTRKLTFIESLMLTAGAGIDILANVFCCTCYSFGRKLNSIHIMCY